MILSGIVGALTVKASEPLQVETKGKPSDPGWRVQDTRVLAHAAGFQPRVEPPKLGEYGGDASREFQATGFFHTRKVDGRWLLVDPDGHPFLHVAINSVTPIRGSEAARAAFNEKFGTEEKWANETVEMLKSHGFNGSGSWSNDALLAKAPRRIAYTRNWNFMSSYGKKRGGTYQKAGHKGYPNDAIFVFDPGFEEFAMRHAATLAATKDDPWLLGHFSDNEMPIRTDNLDKFLRLPGEDAGYKAARQWLERRKGGKFDPKSINNEDRDAFVEFYMNRYFSIVSKAIRAHDPNHLYLGSRFHGQANKIPGAFRAAGKYCDVIAINYYRVWTPDFAQMRSWQEWSGKPFMITEFYAKGADSGMPNTSGAGWLVKTQRDRGLFYQNFCIALLESKGCVGWHHFKYQDNDMENKNVDPSNIDSNKGIVTSTFSPYPAFLQVMRQLNLNVYDLMNWMDQGGGIHAK
jgi:hypothetical protein